jgi:hypothetical protein
LESYPLVVLANEPTAYRSLLASELPFLQRDLRILEINPADLEAVVATLHPSVVVCSRRIAHLCISEVSILELHAGEDATVLQTLDRTIVNPRLSDILGAINRAVRSKHPETPASQEERLSTGP